MDTDSERQRIEHTLRTAGIDPTQPGFYSHPAFIELCAADPSCIELYGRWVDLRPRDAAYEARVREIVPRLCDIILSTLKADGWEGACVDAASMMIRMLERLGIWSYGILGSTTFIVEPEHIRCGFYRHDFQDFPMAVLGHAWLIAPPFRLVDPTVSQQCWGDDPVRHFLPGFIATEDVIDTTPDVSDVISWRMREYFASMDNYVWDEHLHLRLQPNLPVFGQHFPAVQYEDGHLQTRYVPINILLPGAPLELLNSDGYMGRPAIAIWRDLVAPAFGVKA
ncbi:hypothetical protein [Asticcacaulis sp. YBE204]|uniref:hypothetical protein n=1 Tax=Asticcacaulis sp. YBE204 TaxID=1282363 RepID=UPI0003C3E79E|nr:hypothetical protein [Asticcacaulis sp. YBE204]ESQ77408.1 hypothetical protein AEYBE204_18010 [Asticcacaulis sp. YBE204]